MSSESPEPTYAEMIALAHAVDPALRLLDCVARKPIQGDAMHKVIGYHAYRGLRHVGWLNEHGSLIPLSPYDRLERPEERRVYVIEEPQA